MYKYMEITCPKCGHKFMWLEHTYKGTIFPVYKRKGYDEILESTVCTKCNTEMVVIKESCSGVDIKDSSIEKVSVLRGI